MTIIRIALLSILAIGLVGCALEDPANVTLNEDLPPIQANVVDATKATFVSTASESKSQKPAIVKLQPSENIMAYVNNAKGPLLIDFYADWCGPCQQQSAVLEQTKAWLEQNKACVVKINVDDHPNLADIFRVQGLPTLIAVKDSKITARQVGLSGQEKIVSLLKP